MSDPFDDFAAEMARRTAKVRQQDQAQRAEANREQAYQARYGAKSKLDIVNDALHRAGNPGLNEQQLRDRAVVSAMASIPLKKGQMLLLGPKSVAMLTGTMAYEGSLPDKLILERGQWEG